MLFLISVMKMTKCIVLGCLKLVSRYKWKPLEFHKTWVSSQLWGRCTDCDYHDDDSKEEIVEEEEEEEEEEIEEEEKEK